MIVVLLLVVIWLKSGFYSVWIQQALVYLPLILTGMSVRLLLLTAPHYVLIGSAILTCFTVFAPLSHIDSAYYYGVAIGVSTTIISVIALLARYISYAWLMVIGQASMAIFLSHTIVSALVRAVLISIDIRNIALHMVLGVASGVIIPLIAFIIIRKNERALKVVGW